jgi:hypothetical protein
MPEPAVSEPLGERTRLAACWAGAVTRRPLVAFAWLAGGLSRNPLVGGSLLPTICWLAGPSPYQGRRGLVVFILGRLRNYCF